MKSKLITILLACIAAIAAQGERTGPRFADDGQLLRPEGYREWIFVGSGLGMSYQEQAVETAPNFSNVYLQPSAYRQFVATGTFPDETVLVMEVVSSGSKASINRQGRFQDGFIGIEAAVKDEKRFPEKWRYFSFIGPDGKALDRAKPFPKQECWSCHNAHGEVDNVFVQFYPVLREARKMSRQDSTQSSR